MKSIASIIIAFIVSSSLVFSQNNSITEEDFKISEFIDGTLALPKDENSKTLAIIIAGSGPTDRDGNQNFMKSNALKKLAHQLTQRGIATFRYDKRTVKQVKTGNIDSATSFDDFVTDAVDVINYFKTADTFSEIYVIGHSQGSLVGMLAAKSNVDGFISLAGAGNNIGDVITEQIGKQVPQLKTTTKTIMDTLKTGKTVEEYPPMLSSIFSKDIQPFMISWMAYYPSEEIKQLDIPVLIVNGTKDLQVPEEEAKLLKQSSPEAELVLIEQMNHVFIEIDGNDLENSKSYNESSRQISTQLIDSIEEFIKSH